MSLQNPLRAAQSFIFGGNTGLTYEQMKAAREFAARQQQALARTPTNVGEGWGAILRGLAAGRAGRSAEAAATEGREKAQSALGAVLQSRLGAAAPQPPSASFLPSGGGMSAPAGGGLPASIVQTESGGNWGALNSEGYGGRGQFGAERLADAARAGIIPAGMTGADYSRAPEQVQLAVENWHKQDILSKLGGYVGTDVDGPGGIPPLTPDSILAVAHLGGTGGAKKFIESGGRYNPADSNGTSLADYAKRHAGGGAMALAEGQQPDLSFVSQMGGQGIDPQLLAVMADPYVSELPEMQQGALAALFERQLAQAYPEQMTPYQQAQVQLGRDQLAWDQQRAIMPEPVKPTDDMREYEFARGQGYQGSFQDFMLENRRAGATNVTVGGEGAPGLGKLSTDYGYVLDPATGQPVIDPQTGLPRAAAVPGSPAAMEAAKVAQAGTVKEGNKSVSTDVITSAAGRAREAASNRQFGGALQGPTSYLPWTDSAEVARQVEVLKSNAKVENLQAMRAASPTGGALGAVSDSENAMLAAKAGALDPSSPNFERDIDDYERTLLRIVHGPEAGDAIYAQTRNQRRGEPAPSADDDLLRKYGG